MRELEAIGAERVGFDDLRARFDVGLVDAENSFRLGGIKFVETALRAHGFVQHRTHRAIGDENRGLQPFVEIENLQVVSARKINLARNRKYAQRFCSMRLATVLIKSYLVRISKRVSSISTNTAGFSLLRM